MSLCRSLPCESHTSAREEHAATSASVPAQRERPRAPLENHAILSSLASEGLVLSGSDDVSILRSHRGIVLIQIILHNPWPFGKPHMFYGVTHGGLPFPIIFRRASDACAFFSSEAGRP
jgi:hypothetical protein